MFTGQQLKELAQSSTLFTNPAPRDGNYIPTLVLGLGGTGIKTLRCLKKHLARNDAQELVLLGIDSDIKENEKYSELPKLSDTEMCIMDAAPAIQRLAQSKEHPEDHRYLLDFLPFEHPQYPNLHQKVSTAIRVNNGAAQFRRAGRLIFTSNATGGRNLHAELRKVRDRLRGITAKQAKEHSGYTVSKETRIFVISSLAGGTGAGGLLDCLALLRLVFDGPMDKITVFSVLPGDLLDRDLRNPAVERPQTRANAIGLLRELQAFRLGTAPRYTFEFGGNLTFDSSERVLLDGNYLVDNRLYDGTDMKDFLDVCNTVALFIYSFVGTGVGSEEASGSINSAIPVDGHKEKIPRCFQALGVAALAYPVDDLEVYCLRHVLTQWLQRWLYTELVPGVVEQTFSTTSTALRLDGADDFRDYFKIEIPGWGYFENEAEKAALMVRNDTDFLAQKNRNEKDLETTLRQYERQIEMRAQAVLGELLKQVDDLALGVIGTKGEAARHLFALLLQKAQEIASTLSTAKAQRTDEKNTIEGKIPEQERWINLLPLGADRWHRQDYISIVRRLFELKHEAAYDRYVEDAINQLVTHLKAKLDRIELLQKGFALDLEYHLGELAAIDRISPEDTKKNQYGVVQQALPFNAFPKWVTAIELKWPDQFIPVAMTREALVEAVWTQMSAPYSDAIKRLDLLAAAEREQSAGGETPLLNRIKSLDGSALPTIKLMDSAPRIDEMVPQKYVAGKDVRTARSSFVGFFAIPPGGAREVSRLNIPSQHILICTQTYEGYGVAHWTGFDAAYRYYEANSWYSHALPDSMELPPLEALSDAESGTALNFGLGLMLELILVQSDGYYLNFSKKDEDFSYLTYAAEPNAFARALNEKLLVQRMEDQSRHTPNKNCFLGGSLAAAMDRFRETDCIERQVEIRSIADKIKNALGKTWLTNGIGTFLKEFTKRKISDSEDQLRAKRMAEALKSHAEEIT